MDREVVFRPAAKRDLNSLYAWIRNSRGDAAVAIAYIRRIRSFCDGLKTFPERGVERDDIRPGLRIAAFERRVLIAYSLTPSSIRIGRVLYGGRDYEALLRGEDDPR